MIFIYCCFQYGHEASLMSEKWAQYMSQNTVTPKSAPCLALQHGVISNFRLLFLLQVFQSFIDIQWWIQDFPLGAWTSD